MSDCVLHSFENKRGKVEFYDCVLHSFENKRGKVEFYADKIITSGRSSKTIYFDDITKVEKFGCENGLKIILKGRKKAYLENNNDMRATLFDLLERHGRETVEINGVRQLKIPIINSFRPAQTRQHKMIDLLFGYVLKIRQDIDLRLHCIDNLTREHCDGHNIYSSLQLHRANLPPTEASC